MNIQTWKRIYQTGKGGKRNSRIIWWISCVKDKVMKMMEGAHKRKKRERQMSFREEMWKSKSARDTGRFRAKRESQKYGKGPTRRYNKRNEDNNGRNDRKKDKNENEVNGGKNANGKTVRPGTNKILRISPRWERQCEQIDKRRKKGQSKYDRPTEDRLANTSRTEDWFTESLYNKKVLELENLWRLARSYNHENPYILGEGKTIVLYES